MEKETFNRLLSEVDDTIAAMGQLLAQLEGSLVEANARHNIASIIYLTARIAWVNARLLRLEAKRKRLLVKLA
jgi:hypothetical protein